MSIKSLADHLGLDPSDVLAKATYYNRKHFLGIKNFDGLTAPQYEVLRALLDEAYMVKVVTRRVNRKHRYGKKENYDDLVHWMETVDLENASTAQIVASMPEYLTLLLPNPHPQMIASAMRDAGYASSVVYIDEDKRQGRRWRRNVVSFI